MKQVASLRYGVVFKKAFCDPEIFTAFVRDVVGVEIKINEVETEKSFDPLVGYVATKYDLYAEDTENRIIVDIQHERFRDHYHRFLHYHCAAILQQVANAQDYRPKLKVFTIVVLTLGDRHKTDVSVIDFDPKTLSGRPLGEIDHKIIYICPKYLDENTPARFQEWLRAIQDSLDEEIDESQYENPQVRRIFDHIAKDMITPEERARMFDEYSYELVKQEAVTEGEARGLAKGLAKGLAEGKRETARNLLALGTMSVEQIAAVVGLNSAEINTLAK